MHQPIHKRPWVRRSLVLLLLLLISYGSYRAIRTNPNLKKVRKLQEEFTSAAATDWTPEQRREKGQEMRAAMEKLTPEQRDSLSAERQKQFEEQMRRYTQMSPTEKIRHLDGQIDRGEKMRQQFAQRTSSTPNGNGQRPQGSPPGGFGAGPSGTLSGGPGGSGSQPISAEDREKRRKERLDKSTPEFRAMMDNYRTDLEARRKQRGLKY